MPTIFNRPSTIDTSTSTSSTTRKRTSDPIEATPQQRSSRKEREGKGKCSRMNSMENRSRLYSCYNTIWIWVLYIQIIEQLVTQPPPTSGHEDIDTITDTTPPSFSQSTGVQATPSRRNIRSQVKPITKCKGKKFKQR